MTSTNAQRDNLLMWADALESGEYVQGKGALKRSTPDGPVHCCLGVYSEMKEVPNEETGFDFYGFTFPGNNGWNSDLPNPMWFLHETGIPAQDAEALADLNDGGSTFDEIATLIRMAVAGWRRQR